MPDAPPTPSQESALSASALRWARRRDTVISILGWIVITGLVVWVVSHVLHATLLMLVAAFLAYALMPAVAFLARFVPRWLAILLVYAAVVSVLGALGYLVFSTAFEQFSMLASAATQILKPGDASAVAPLVRRLEQLGISRDQIQTIGSQIFAQTQVLAAGIVPLLESVFGTVLDLVLVIVLSVYIMVDGRRVAQWLRTSAPVKMRPRVTFMMSTLQRVVGGYIRGQLILSTLIGLLVGLGKTRPGENP